MLSTGMDMPIDIVFISRKRLICNVFGNCQPDEEGQYVSSKQVIVPPFFLQYRYLLYTYFLPCGYSNDYFTKSDKHHFVISFMML